MNNIEYISGGIELLQNVKPLWEKLNQHHTAKSENFSENFRNMTFEARKAKFENTNTMFRIDLVKDTERNLYIGYCISSINDEGTGEVESIFLESEYRSFGIGDELMNKAVLWFDENKVKTRLITVADGNESVFKFYGKHGFFRRRTVLQQIIEE